MNSQLITSAKTVFTAILILILNMSYGRIEKQDPPLRKESASDIQVNARIRVNTKNTIGSYKLEVMYRDIVISSLNVKNNASVKLQLKKDSPYVLKISKKGYIPRYICINTSLYDKTNKDFYSFNFETDFIAVSDAMMLDNEALQLPVALVTFNRKAGNFDYNKDYSFFVQQKIYSGVSQMSPLTIKD